MVQQKVRDDFQMQCCGCCDDCGLCVFDACCPCFMLCEAADNIGSSGCLYCIATICGFGCCALGVLGEKVAKKRGIKDFGMGKSCCLSFLNCCTCFSCRVVNESRLYKANPGGPNAQAMSR